LRTTREEIDAVHDEHEVAMRAEADVKVAKAEVERRQARLKEIERRKNPYAEIVRRAKERAAEAKEEVEALGNEVSDGEEDLKPLRFWVEAFGAKGLRSLLLDTSLPLLNEEARRVSEAVTDGMIDVEFSAVSELKSGKTVDRFEVKVDNEHGAGDYAGNSAGERAKVDLCVGLAIQKLVASRSRASFNLVFFDECLDHVDASAHERIVEVLGELTGGTPSVFVISHDEDLASWFPHRMTVKRRSGYSVIVDA
jgi:DNA repair exonuclease SbcCD ATPase subunit